MSRQVTVAEAAAIIGRGGVVAYPTEAVFGLGCDPFNEAAVARLLDIKCRPVDKGLILIAASYGQLLPFIDTSSLAPQRLNEIRASWPGPNTWVMPAKRTVPSWLTGRFDSIAVRVTDHHVAADLCRASGGALVSTSANLAQKPPARSQHEVLSNLGPTLDAVVSGSVGGNSNPSTITDAISGERLR